MLNAKKIKMITVFISLVLFNSCGVKDGPTPVTDVINYGIDNNNSNEPLANIEKESNDKENNNNVSNSKDSKNSDNEDKKITKKKITK